MEDRRWWLLNALFALFVACALLGPSKAHAATTYPALQGWSGTYVPVGQCNTMSCFCTGYKAGYNANNSTQLTTFTIQNPPGQCTFTTATGGTLYKSASPGAASCGANSTLSGSTCTCSAGLVVNAAATACEPPADKCYPKLGVAATGEITIPTAGQIVPGSACIDGCTFAKTFDSGGLWGKLNGSWTWAGKGADFIGNGASCTAVPTGTGSPTDPGAAPLPNPPPKGMCPGTVNGVAVNVPCDTTASNNPGPAGTGGTGAGGLAPPPPGASGGAADPGATGAPGAGSFSPAPPASAPPGAKPGDKASNGTCTGDKCAKTECVVVLKADFSMEKQCGTTYEDKGTFCKNNPGDPKCKAEQSSFVGTCEAPVACTGDAIQCQVAKQQLADSCDARKVSDATQAIYTGLKGTGVSVTGLDASFNIGGMLPAGPSQTCALSDTSFALMDGFSVSMPLGTLLCDKLGVIRGVIAAFGFVMWSIIVFGLRGN